MIAVTVAEIGPRKDYVANVFPEKRDVTVVENSRAYGLRNARRTVEIVTANGNVGITNNVDMEIEIREAIKVVNEKRRFRLKSQTDIVCQRRRRPKLNLRTNVAYRRKKNRITEIERRSTVGKQSRAIEIS
jgi:hypothetical protein